MKTGEMTLVEELWKYFDEKYFSSDLPYLDNFSIRNSEVIFCKLIIIGISIGIIVAALCNLFNKRYVGNFVRKLIKEDCMRAENAKTLSELGYSKSLGIRYVIKSGGSLSRWVRCAEEDEFLEALAEKKKEFEEQHASDKKPPKFKEPQFKRDLNKMHFYLPEEKKYSAEIRFDPKGAHLLGVILVTVVSISLCLWLCYMLTDIIKLFDNFINVIGK